MSALCTLCLTDTCDHVHSPHRRPEGLVKISSGLYESILPCVKAQVESQLRVRDLSNASVTLSPADFSSWTEAKNELVMSAKKTAKALYQTQLGATSDAAQREELNVKWTAREAEIEHEIDYEPISVSLELAVEYNFLAA